MGVIIDKFKKQNKIMKRFKQHPISSVLGLIRIKTN